MDPCVKKKKKGLWVSRTPSPGEENRNGSHRVTLQHRCEQQCGDAAAFGSSCFNRETSVLLIAAHRRTHKSSDIPLSHLKVSRRPSRQSTTEVRGHRGGFLLSRCLNSLRHNSSLCARPCVCEREGNVEVCECLLNAVYLACVSARWPRRCQHPAL